MFEMRLGLALQKTRKEIRALDATEYRDWELMYMLEPWGWHNQEYLIGKILCAMYNIANNGKKAFTPKEFMRDMEELRGLRGSDLSVMTQEERDAYIEEHREEIRSEAKRAFRI